MKQHDEVCDVTIVGAGLAGLTAANMLLKQGLSVRILEANDRIGGRVLDLKTKHGYTLSLGATWLGPDEEKVPALLKEIGLETVPQYFAGEMIIRLQGKQWISECDETLQLGPVSLPADGVEEDFAKVFDKILAQCKEVSLETPYNHPDASQLDAITVWEWLQQQQLDEKGKALMRLYIECMLMANITKMSFLSFLFIWHALVTHIADDRRIAEGPLQIIAWLAKPVQDRLHLRMPVQAVEQGENSVVVHTADGSAFESRYVIVAIPPHLCAAIAFTPALSASRLQLTNKIQMSKSLKVFVTYETPFWREQGLSGTALTDEGILNSSYDVSPDGGSHGVLVGFMAGGRAHIGHTLSKEARRDAVIQQLIGLYGAQASSPIDYVDHDWWAEPWTGGCYCSFTPPNVLTATEDAIRKPIGRIHWAGTETATRWYGSMEGAILSGERASEEILARRGEDV